MRCLDYRVSKEKFFDRPIYAQAIRELTPTKPEKKEEQRIQIKSIRNFWGGMKMVKMNPRVQKRRKEIAIPR